MAQREMAQPEVEGFRGPQVCTLIGISYRQLDYLGPRPACSAPRWPRPVGVGRSGCTPTATCLS